MTDDTFDRDLLHTRHHAIATRLVALADHALTTDQPALVAEALAVFRDLKQDTATLAADIEAHLVACWADRGPLEVADVGVFELHRRTKRTGWRHDELVADVLDTVDGGDGLPPEVFDALAAVRECVSFGAGKVGGLKARGLQPDEYCNESPDGWSVQLPPRNHERDVA